MNLLGAVICVVLLAVCFWSVLCRLSTIALTRTNLVPAAQHFSLGSGLILAATAMAMGWDGTLPMLVGLSMYLLAGAKSFVPPRSDATEVPVQSSALAVGERS
jgi:hypothetical protein